MTPVKSPLSNLGRRFPALQHPTGAPVLIVCGMEALQIVSRQSQTEVQSEFGYSELQQVRMTSEEGLWAFSARDRLFTFITDDGEKIVEGISEMGGFPPPPYSPPAAAVAQY